MNSIHTQIHRVSPGSRFGFACAAFLAVLGLARCQSDAQVVLSELLADNRGAVELDSTFPDYVELHNTAALPAILDSYSLTDDPANPRRFVFPSGTVIAAGGRLIVWCAAPGASPGLYAGFGLGSSGDQVRLYAADGVTVLDQIQFGLQAPDLSLGRVGDGAGAWTPTAPSPGSPNVAAVLGAASQLLINEWMARPASGEDWIELFNADPLPVPLTGLVLTDRASGAPSNRAIPNYSFVAGSGFAQMFASDLASMDADHLDFKLSADGETLTLYAADRATILNRVIFGAQGDDISQGRSPDGSDRIQSFTGNQISPNGPNFVAVTSVVISEVLAHTDPPLEDAIELHNLSTSPVDISHWWLSDSAARPQKYRVPAGTILAPGGHAVFYEFQFGAGPEGFQLNSYEGEDVFLSSANALGELLGPQTSIEFGPSKNSVAMGRHSTSVGVDWTALHTHTFGVSNPTTLTQFRQGRGASNATARVGPVVLAEIMYQPGTFGEAEEFIELVNITAQPVPLFDPLHPQNTWRLRDGISFDFPPGVVLAVGGRALVVAFDPIADPTRLAAFRTRHGVPEGTPILGPWQGALSNSGERIELLWPDKPEGPESGQPGLVPYESLESVTYDTTAPWPDAPASGRYALTRAAPNTYANDPVVWTAMPPSPGTAGEPDQDSDADGIPDAWELQFGLNPYSAADADLDADADGVANGDEYLAGTNPNDATSVFRVLSVAGLSSSLLVEFYAVSNRAYRIEWRPLDLESPWQTAVNVEAGASNGIRAVVVPQNAPAALLRLATP